MKKFVALLLVSVLLVSTAACAGNGNSSGGSTGTTGTTTTDSGGSTASDSGTAAEETAEAAYDTVFPPATYTVYMGDSLNNVNTQWGDTEVGKIIEEITGIKLDIEFIVGSDELERAALIIATGDYRDIIMPHNVGASFIDAGAVIPLNDLYDEHCVNIKRHWGNAIERVKDIETGILWGLSTEGYNAPNIDQPFAAFYLKHAAVAQNGYKTITDPNEYFDIIRRYVAENPTTNGQSTIGFSGPAETWRYVFTLLMAERLYGFPNTGRRIFHPQEDYKVYDRNTQVYRYNYLSILNDLHLEGLLDPEYFSQTHDEYVAKIASGRVVGFGDEPWEVGDAFNLIKQEQRIDDVYIPFALKYENEAVPGMGCPYAGISAMAIRINTMISSKAKDPVGILKYLDYLASDEMLELIYWGVEDVHYQKDSNGRNYLTGEQYDERGLDVDFANRTGIGHVGVMAPHPLEMFVEKPDGSGVWDPMVDPVDRAKYIYDDMQKEVLSRMGWTSFMGGTGERWKSPFGFGWEITVPTDNDRLNDINALYESEMGGENCPMWTQGMVLANSKAEFDALWDDMNARLQALGVEELNQFFTDRARERVADFNRGS